MPKEKPENEAPKKKGPSPKPRVGLFAILALTLAFIYFVRQDGAQAIHWWPMPLWTPLVLVPFFTLRPKKMIVAFLSCGLVWFGMLVLLNELPLKLFAAPLPRAETSIRIVSLNCAGGSAAAAREAFEQGAQIVLLQEVGNRQEFEAIAAEKGYRSESWGVDDAVYSVFPMSDLRSGQDYAAGTVAIPKSPVRVVSLRLTPPVFRLDWWTSECWSKYESDLSARRERVAFILAKEAPGLIGGDFNATNPRIVRDTASEMHEAGRSAGIGWQGTGTNDFPFSRVDQIWGSQLHWEQAWVMKTRNSDHRMVVADFTP